MIQLKVAAFPNNAKHYLKKYNKNPTNKIHNTWKPVKIFFLGMQISLEIWPIKTRRVNYRNRPRSDPDASI